MIERTRYAPGMDIPLTVDDIVVGKATVVGIFPDVSSPKYEVAVFRVVEMKPEYRDRFQSVWSERQLKEPGERAGDRVQ